MNEEEGKTFMSGLKREEDQHIKMAQRGVLETQFRRRKPGERRQENVTLTTHSVSLKTH